MDYELAKKLKHAGFPQKELEFNCQYCPIAFGKPEQPKVYFPTLSELINECIKSKPTINFCLRNFNTGDNNYWICGSYMSYENDWIEYTTGLNPEETVANLYLILNKK